MKRSIDEDHANDSLQYRAIAIAFDQLPLEKKRQLMPELLKSARVIHGAFLAPVEDKFRFWLTRGNVKQFTETDVEKLWALWCHVKRTATSSSPCDTDDARITFDVIYQDDYIHEREDTFCIYSPTIPGTDADRLRRLKKEEYFEWILANTRPEDVKLGDPELGFFYTFPNLTCDHIDCRCDMSPLALEGDHYWPREVTRHVSEME